MKFSPIALSLFFASQTSAQCPHLAGEATSGDLSQHHHTSRRRQLNPNVRVGDYGVPEGGYQAVMDYIEDNILTNSQDFWPADFGNYGGLFIRLAWHCSGSYRQSDGRGGCDGGRIRFDPEINWMDNGNLNQALKLLEPVKAEFGSSLSWGDLIILAGTTAIKSMGGPFLGFCGGRIDDADGSNSIILGPTEVQEEFSPCVSIGRSGTCTKPMGQTTPGLIYVDAAGPVGKHGDPVASAEDIREVFARMGFNDAETVSLVGGGHAFGKMHGACTADEAPCGEGDLQGIGPNTRTSGFEGAWTTIPTQWSNQYFNNLLNLDWTLIDGPGGQPQFKPNTTDPIAMLTTDIAMISDADYLALSKTYASDISVLEDDFARSWYRLTTQDMGPVDRCMGDMVPDAQIFQMPLPAAPETKPDYSGAKTSIMEMLDDVSVPALVNLAYRCAETFRETDYFGGCNGARIRFPPESEWESNAGTSDALAMLKPIKEANPDVTYADLIVLAGQLAIEKAGGESMAFCGGRVDAAAGDAGTAALEPRVHPVAVISIRDDAQVKGLTPEEYVSLFARPISGATLSNQYFVDLQAGTGTYSEIEQALLDPEFASIVQSFADDNAVFLETFAKAWTQMMTADRFDGPRDNACADVDDLTAAPADAPAAAPTSGAAFVFAGMTAIATVTAATVW